MPTGQGGSLAREQDAPISSSISMWRSGCVGGGRFHCCTLSKSSPLAQEHCFGFGTSFHTSFFILEKKAADNQVPLLFPSISASSSILTGFERGSG